MGLCGRTGRKRRPQFQINLGISILFFLLSFWTLPGLQREELMNNGSQCDLCGASSALFSRLCDLMKVSDPAHTKVWRGKETLVESTAHHLIATRTIFIGKWIWKKQKEAEDNFLLDHKFQGFFFWTQWPHFQFEWRKQNKWNPYLMVKRRVDGRKRWKEERRWSAITKSHKEGSEHSEKTRSPVKPQVLVLVLVLAEMIIKPQVWTCLLFKFVCCLFVVQVSCRGGRTLGSHRLLGALSTVEKGLMNHFVQMDSFSPTLLSI